MLSGLEIAEAVERHKIYLNPPEEAKKLGEFLGVLTAGKFKMGENEPRIVIENFDSRPSHEGGRLNPNSYNLTLANKLQIYAGTAQLLREGQEIDGGIYGGRTSTTPGLQEWQVTLDTRSSNAVEEFEIPDAGFVLRPGILYLGMTNEWTESYNCVPRIDGRSSIGRLGIGVHVTAGFGDCGFKGRFVLEITTVHPVRIYSGLALCQISYHRLGPHFDYAGRKYQNQEGVTASRLYMDWEKS